MTNAAVGRTFRDDLGVFVCDHDFRASTPVRLCVRDWGASWQFLCGQDDLTAHRIHLVHIGALLDRDETLAQLTVLKPGSYAERKSIDVSWEFGDLERGDEAT